MKKSEKIINMWEKWKPEGRFITPYLVVQWYWENHLRKNGLQPIFPMGEIHDLAAVIADSKPAAMLDCGGGINDSIGYCYGIKDWEKIQSEIFKTASDCGVKSLFCKEDKDMIFSKSDKIINDIYNALKNHNGRALGLALGYPPKAVEDFMASGDTMREEVMRCVRNNQAIEISGVIDIKDWEKPSLFIPKNMFIKEKKKYIS